MLPSECTMDSYLNSDGSECLFHELWPISLVSRFCHHFHVLQASPFILVRMLNQLAHTLSEEPKTITPKKDNIAKHIVKWAPTLYSENTHTPKHIHPIMKQNIKFTLTTQKKGTTIKRKSNTHAQSSPTKINKLKKNPSNLKSPDFISGLNNLCTIYSRFEEDKKNPKKPLGRRHKRRKELPTSQRR